MTDLTNGTALVTESARGIGEAIGLRYASLGAAIALDSSGHEANVTTTLAEIQRRVVKAAIGVDASMPVRKPVKTGLGPTQPRRLWTSTGTLEVAAR